MEKVCEITASFNLRERIRERIMEDTSMRALGFVAFYCFLALSNINGTTTSSPVSRGHQYGPGCLDHGVFFTSFLPSSVRISMRARSVGFCGTNSL